MPKKLATNLKDRVLEEIGRHDDGVSAGSLAEKFGEEASRRSLARIIKQLQRRGEIVAEGRARSVRYRQKQRPTRLSNELKENAAAVPAAEPYVPMSPDGGMVFNWVRRPLTQRQPVGYNRAFLDAYQPNETYYLADAPRREWLNNIGRTSMAPRPAGTYARDILNRLLIDLSWASSKLEGNTYTRLDTEQLIEHGREAEGKDHTETLMILNHKRAIEFLVDQAVDIRFNRFTLLNLHALLSENLLLDPAASGRLRTRIVDIGGTVFRPLAIPQQIEELFDMFLSKAALIQDPFESAFFAMVHLPYLQPFEDVNKRVSRLAANIPLIRSNLCPLSFVDVPERAYVDGLLGIYEHTRMDLLRDVFLWAYERSCQQFRAITAGLPAPDPFRLKYRVELGDAIAEVVKRGWHADWEFEEISGKLVPAKDRRRFEEMMREELRNLHEGNIARYHIRLEDFRAWAQEK